MKRSRDVTIYKTRGSIRRAINLEVSNCIQLQDLELYKSYWVERKEGEVLKRQNRAVLIKKYQISFAVIKQEVSNNY